MNFKSSNFYTCRMPTKISKFIFKCVKIILKLIREAIIIISLIQHFEADFLWKVSLKILKSGLILSPMHSEAEYGILYEVTLNLIEGLFANRADTDQAALPTQLCLLMEI